MALVKCPDCGAEVSQEALACPKCGKPRVLRTAYSQPVSGGTIILAGFILAGVIWFHVHDFGTASAAPSSTSSQSSDREIDSAVAFGLCEKTIKAYAKNPSEAVIPNRPNMAAAGGFMFDWRHGDGLQLQNGYGAKIDAVATCVVAPDKNTVSALIIDGKKLIYRKPK